MPRHPHSSQANPDRDGSRTEESVVSWRGARGRRDA